MTSLTHSPQGTAREVLIAFLKLGISSFGGPIAHLSYFRETFVVRYRWLEDSAYADLVALCQILPGPTSSQVGFAIGLKRAGPLGALGAWLGFSLPSILIMIALAFGSNYVTGPWMVPMLHGLKLVAVMVVGQAVWGMARSLTPDFQRGFIAIAAIGVMVLWSSAFTQLCTIAFGAFGGIVLCRTKAETPLQRPQPLALVRLVSKPWSILALLVFLALLGLGFNLIDLAGYPALERFNAFYHSGALVFGGGHVVLPLLKQAVVTPGWVDQDRFLAGYGMAQALPGPLFSFAAFLGASMQGAPTGLIGALIATLGIFSPGLLILMAMLPYWSSLQSHQMTKAALQGVNAAVVGILAASLYNPLWTSSIKDPSDMSLVITGFLLLNFTKCPPLILVVLSVLISLIRIL